ncbi:uncharacterized protein LOC144475567 [Augochlora pura]
MNKMLLLVFVVLVTITETTKGIRGKERELSWKNSMSDKSIARIDPERVNKGFDMIVRGVNVLGRLDNFISDRTKDIVRKLHAMYHEDHKNARNNFNRH